MTGIKLKIPFCEDYYYLLCQIRPLENCHHHHYCSWHAIMSIRELVRRKPSLYVVLCILFSFGHRKSVSPAEPFLYPTLLHLFYENFHTNTRE